MIVRNLTDVFEKDPSSIEPIVLNWQDWLNDIAEDETLATVDFSATGSTLSFSNEIVTGAIEITKKDGSTETTRASTAAQATMSGGRAGHEYTVTCRVTTNSGFRDDRSFPVRVVER